MSERPLQLVLASASPRRAELLRRLQLSFRVSPVGCDETPLEGESAEAMVVRLATAKSVLGWRGLSTDDGPLPVLGADTAVVVGDRVLGKPDSRAAAAGMVERLGGGPHEVLTAIAVTGPEGDGATRTRLSRSVVWFAELDRDQIDRYAATGEGMDKAGGYGIQDIGGILVRRIEGSHSGIMGLPIFETEALLREFGVDTWRYRS